MNDSGSLARAVLGSDEGTLIEYEVLMLDDLKQDALERMAKTVEALSHDWRIRTAERPRDFDAIKVDYYGSDTPIAQVAQIKVGMLQFVSPWKRTWYRRSRRPL